MPIEVHFAHRKAVFRPGDFITGHVLVISQDMSGCEGIELEWQGRVRLTNKNNQIGTYVIFRTAQVLNHQDIGNQGETRSRSIPFKHRLPSPIPPSYIGRTPYGEVQYSVAATLKRKWESDSVEISVTKRFSVVTAKELIPLHLKQIKINHLARAKMCCSCWFPTIEIGITLDRRGYAPGEDAAINMAMMNNSGKEIVGVNLKLIQLVSVVCPAGYSYQRSVVHELDLHHIIIPSSPTPHALPMKQMPMPATLPTYDTGNDIMSIKYELQCIVCLPPFYDDVVMSIPIIIGTYPAELTPLLRKMNILPKEGTVLRPPLNADLGSPAFATSIEEVTPTSSMENLHSTCHENEDSDNCNSSDEDDLSMIGKVNRGYQASSAGDLNKHHNTDLTPRWKNTKIIYFEKRSDKSWIVRYVRIGSTLQKPDSPATAKAER